MVFGKSVPEAKEETDGLEALTELGLFAVIVSSKSDFLLQRQSARRKLLTLGSSIVISKAFEGSKPRME